MKLRHVFLSVMIVGLSISCSNDDDQGKGNVPLGAYENGILVSNEGPFSNGTGTVSFISNDLSVVENGIFKKINNEDLGNIVHSIGFTEDDAFIVANVSNKINIVNRNTFQKTGTITVGLENPRSFAASNGKGYVTNWGDPADDTDDYVAIIDLLDNVVEGTIPVDFGPDAIIAKGTTLYVAHQGGYGHNNKVSVINAVTNELIKTITVGDAPNSMQLDASGNLWVLASGKPDYTQDETAGVLSRINTVTNEVTTDFQFDAAQHPGLLNIEGNDLYFYLGDTVYKQDIAAATLSLDVVLSGAGFYTMAINDGRLYATNAGDYASNGTLTVYDLSTKQAIETLTVGIIPGGVYFN